MTLDDLQKAFDWVEYPVMLERLYEVGVNGKCWRLMKSWYEGATCQVKVDDGTLVNVESWRNTLEPTILILFWKEVMK